MYPSYSRKHLHPNSCFRSLLRTRTFQQTPRDANHLSETTDPRFAVFSPTESACLDENLEMNQTQILLHSSDFVQKPKSAQDPLLRLMVSDLEVKCENLCSCALMISTPVSCAVTHVDSEMRNFGPVMIPRFVRQPLRSILHHLIRQLPLLVFLLDS